MAEGVDCRGNLSKQVRCDSDPDGLFGFVDETWTPSIGKSPMNEFQPPYLPAVSQCNAVMLYSIFAHHVVLMYLWMCESDCVQYTSQKPCKPYPLCSPCSRQAWSSTLLGSNSCQGLSGPRRIQHCCWCMFLGIGGIPKSLLTGHLNFLMQHTW